MYIKKETLPFVSTFVCKKEMIAVYIISLIAGGATYIGNIGDNVYRDTTIQ